MALVAEARGFFRPEPGRLEAASDRSSHRVGCERSTRLAAGSHFKEQVLLPHALIASRGKAIKVPGIDTMWRQAETGHGAGCIVEDQIEDDVAAAAGERQTMQPPVGFRIMRQQSGRQGEQGSGQFCIKALQVLGAHRVQFAADVMQPAALGSHAAEKFRCQQVVESKTETEFKQREVAACRICHAGRQVAAFDEHITTLGHGVVDRKIDVGIFRGERQACLVPDDVRVFQEGNADDVRTVCRLPE